jgi:cation:H+ antiporter
MATALALPLLAVSLAVTLAAARTFARRLDRLGVAFGLPEALVGLLTALAADGPEISSALVALAKGDHGVGVGVLVGSNAFNLAAMIGVSALLTGAVTVRRGALALEGAMGLAATLLAAAVLLGALAPAIAFVALIGVAVVYLLALFDGPRLTARLPLRASARERVETALAEHEQRPPARGEHEQRPPAHGEHRGDAVESSQRSRDAVESSQRSRDAVDARAHHALWIVSDVALILAGSFGMVQAALALGGHWGVSGTLVGGLVLAPLTSLPNAATGIRLGLARRGSALVSETLNSNTINLAGGVMAPALITTIGISSSDGRFDLAWLVAMTVVCLAFLARARGAGRGAGIVLVLMYAGFVAVQLGS